MSTKFDKVVVAELQVNLLTNPSYVEAKGAFISTQTGATHGYTTCTNWSKSVMLKLKELTEAMSAEMQAIHFDGVPVQEFNPSTSGPQGARVQGLGDHIGTGAEDVPQG